MQLKCLFYCGLLGISGVWNLAGWEPWLPVGEEYLNLSFILGEQDVIHKELSSSTLSKSFQ